MSVTTASVVSSSKAAARIRAAAIEAFAEHGYGGTTTRDIAARLGLSAAAMYPHYKSKEELLFVIAYEGHQKTVEWLQAADPVSESPASRLRAVVGEFARTQAAYHGRSRVVEYELTALSPDHYRVIVGLRRKLTRHVREIVEAGVADGLLRFRTARASPLPSFHCVSTSAAGSRQGATPILKQWPSSTPSWRFASSARLANRND